MKKRIIKITAISLSVILLILCGYTLVCHLLRIKQQKEWEQLFENYYADKISIYQQENEKYADYEVDVAFLGDSLTDGCDLSRYYPDYLCVNRGIGGDTTFGLEKRLKVSAYDLKPKVVVMLIGANNFDTMFDNYENILIGLKENLPDTQVVLLSLTAMGGEHWGKNNAKACYNNVKIQLLAKEYGFHFVDLFTPLFDYTTGEVREGYTTDGGHFTHEGYLVVTGKVNEKLAEILG